MTNVVQHDAANNCYRVTLEGDYQAVVKYQQQDNVLHITSTRVPDELQGKGYGKVMMESVLPEIERAGFTVVPVCSYVVHYLERHPEWQHLRHRAV
ncbi:GNAT family N-acetyltransferase [Vibrio metoecus]|uniref:GNAT family N-acetyltransferase n=1 Tax=Vibrio metoecus TaxID=1481663 RepID=UPI0006D81437|nr:GNAT family N-acetyltransferase [Vibrio metoecus]KQA20635.1 acetyltransferase [Vibrio metoecus]